MTVGAAPGCRLLPIRWPSSGPSLFIGDTRMRRVLDYIGTRADIMSNSWGSVPISTWAQTTENRIDELARTGGRRGRGIVFLWAAGNDNCPISHVANQDVPFNSGWNFGTSPATWVGVDTARVFRNDLAGRQGVMHVAALTSTARRSHYSNYGTGIGICAPTSNLHTYRRLLLEGFGITTTRGFDTVTDSFGGTSSATPLVAGIAALVISANPDLSAAQVIEVLKQTASKDLDFEGWPGTPPASFDLNTVWDISPIAPFNDGAFQVLGLPEGTWSPWFGHGNVNAAAAVRRALDLAGGSTTQVSASRTENLPIPDRNAAGVSSSIVIPEHGRIRDLRITVDITHTYRGDLLVRLVAPDGRRAVLHRRSGGSTNNLIETYDVSTAAELAPLFGSEINGVWVLETFDLASIDIGNLNRWGIEATVVTDGALRLESTPGVTIPDNDSQGVTDSVSTNDARVVSNIEVDVDITHSYIGDLEITLNGPTGQSAVLKARDVGGGADNIQRTFGPGEVTDLNRFVGVPANGRWELHTADHAGADVGKLNRWGLVIR